MKRILIAVLTIALAGCQQAPQPVPVPTPRPIVAVPTALPAPSQAIQPIPQMIVSPTPFPTRIPAPKMAPVPRTQREEHHQFILMTASLIRKTSDPIKLEEIGNLLVKSSNLALQATSIAGSKGLNKAANEYLLFRAPLGFLQQAATLKSQGNQSMSDKFLQLAENYYH